MRSTAFASLILAALAAAPAQAQSVQAKAIQAWDAFTAANAGIWLPEWSKSGDRVVSLRGRSAAIAGAPAEAAAAFLSSNADILGIPADLTDLTLVSTRRSPAGSHVTYQQTYGDLPVFHSFIDVHINKSGQVYLLHSNYSPGAAARARSAAPALSAGEAIRAAQRAHAGVRLADKKGRAFSARSLRVTGRPELGIQQTATGDRLAYRVIVGPVRYTIDAGSGAVLEAVSLMQSAQGEGRIFDPNPVNTLKDGSLKDMNDTNYVAIRDAYFLRTLLGINKSNGKFRLKGPHVRALDLKASNVGSCMNGETEVRKPPPVRNNNQFKYNRSQGGFEHTMIYSHIDRNQRYIQSLGFDDLWNKAIRVDAHGITDDNSFYCANPIGSGYLAFGDGGVDDAEDADVVLHEYGHALQDAASMGRYLGGGQKGAMGEGFGDYWAYIARPFGKWGTCFAEWDAEGGCLRKVNKNKRFPDDYVGQVHKDGEIWSRGLRDLRLELGKNPANQLILISHHLVPADVNFVKAVDAILDADEALFDGDNQEKICSIFIDRGISAKGCGYWMLMSWNKLGADVDLRLRPPSCAGNTTWHCTEDVYYLNTNPNWGDPNSADDDPLLYRDCVTTCTSEQITVDTIPDPGTYRVIAHYYRDHGLGATHVTMEVFRRAKRVFEGGINLSNVGDTPTGGDVWFAYDIVIPAPLAAPQIVEVNRVVRGSGSPGRAPTKD